MDAGKFPCSLRFVAIPQVGGKAKDKRWAIPYTFAGEKSIREKYEDSVSRYLIGILSGREKKPPRSRKGCAGFHRRSPPSGGPLSVPIYYPLMIRGITM
jgi:hypothetical protein